LIEIDSQISHQSRKKRSSRILKSSRKKYRNRWKIKDEKGTSTWRGSSRGWSEGNERARVVGGSRGGGGG